MVKDICRKVSCQLNVLQRLKSKLDDDSRMEVYNAFIVSNLIYAQIVWMHCGAANIKKLEKLNERALRFVNYDSESEYEIQLIKADKNRLITTRIINMGVEVFKAKMGMSPVYIQEMFLDAVNNYNLRATNTLYIPKFNTRTFGYRSFSYMGAKLWNVLPNELREVSALPRFKELVKYWGREHLKIEEFV